MGTDRESDKGASIEPKKSSFHECKHIKKMISEGGVQANISGTKLTSLRLEATLNKVDVRWVIWNCLIAYPEAAPGCRQPAAAMTGQAHSA
jgi:hypothetical protein